MSREPSRVNGRSAMRLLKSLGSSTSMMDRKPLSPAAAYAKWASREMRQRRRCEEATANSSKEESKTLQKSAAKSPPMGRPKVARLAPRQQGPCCEELPPWEEGSSPTPSVTFLPKSQLWPEQMPQVAQKSTNHGHMGDEPPQVRAPPPSPRLRHLDFNRKVFSRFFDEAVATTKRRQQHANATFDDSLTSPFSSQ